MSGVRSGVLAGCLVLVVAVAAAAQLPDPNLSTVELDPQSSVLPGLQTCPAGDGDPFEYIKITVYDAMAVPIPGLPAENFEFIVVGGDVSFHHAPFTPETGPDGVIYFSVVANESIAHPESGGAPLEIQVSYYGYFLGMPVYLSCNTFDYDLDGVVAPPDFARFAGDFGGPYERSDFSWSGGDVNPVDFAKFAGHFAH